MTDSIVVVIVVVDDEDDVPIDYYCSLLFLVYVPMFWDI
jgi:hypothetical protein